VHGQPSIPPSLVVLEMLLQYHDDSSDMEAGHGFQSTPGHFSRR
jgi:hypothetical protein